MNFSRAVLFKKFVQKKFLRTNHFNISDFVLKPFKSMTCHLYIAEILLTWH